MGEIHNPKPVLLVIAVSSRYHDVLFWAAERCAEHFGDVALSSEAFSFTETDYYQATMGAGLKKQFLAFGQIDPARLPAIKRTTNHLEARCAAEFSYEEPRPLNLDPGYITMAKLVLASTKDHSHRIYLAEGIYAEVTLNFRAGRWQSLPWTYPDYQRGDYQQFFSTCRQLLRKIV